MADNQALLVATLVRQAVVATDNRADQRRLITYASRIAREGLGRKTIAAGCLYDRGAARSTTDVLRLVAERAEQSGNVNVAEAILEALANITALEEETLGRVLADRARTSMKRGFTDLSTAQYEDVLRRGRRQGSSEMQARAWMGLAALAQVRGNFPEMRRALLKGLPFAESAGIDRLIANGESGLGVQAAMAGRNSAAVEHFWNGYKHAHGDRRLEPELLTNMAQAFQDSGRPEAARVAAGTVLKSSPALRVAFPALGVYALASAALGDHTAVEWSTKQAVRLAKRGYARAVAGTLLDCASAFGMLGQSTQAGVLERRAQTMAVKHGFNDLTFRRAAVVPAKTGAEQGRRVAAVAIEVAKLGSEAIPSDLELAAVGDDEV